MSITPEQIDSWRAEPTEGCSLEFKEAKNQFDSRKLRDYCIAIGNEGGGYLVLGVADQAPRPVVGSKSFPNVATIEAELLQSLGFRVRVHEVAHPDGRVVVFDIPGRPQGSAFQLDGRYLMRAGDSLVPMSEDQLRTIFAEGAPDWLEEPSTSGLDEQTVVELLDTQGFFELLDVPYPTHRVGVLDKLVETRLIDQLRGGWSIRRLGALLLARRLEDFSDLALKAPRVVVYSGTSKLSTKLDQLGVKGYAAGFRGLIRFVVGQLPQNEVVEDALRTDVKLAPETVVRELVANALVHQDFSITGASVMIEIYSNRLEISNPGSPLVPVERFIDGYQSRNERLADLMRRMRIFEGKGSGIDSVVQAAERYQLPAPDFREFPGRTSVTIAGPKPFENMGRGDRVRACYQHCVLCWVMHERMTNQSLRQRFGLPATKAATVSQVIALAVESQLVKPDEAVGGSRKYARYVPVWA